MSTHTYQSKDLGIAVTVQDNGAHTVEAGDYRKLQNECRAVVIGGMPAMGIIGLLGGGVLGAAIAFANTNKAPAAAEPVALPAVTAPAPIAP